MKRKHDVFTGNEAMKPTGVEEGNEGNERKKGNKSFSSMLARLEAVKNDDHGRDSITKDDPNLPFFTGSAPPGHSQPWVWGGGEVAEEGPATAWDWDGVDGALVRYGGDPVYARGMCSCGRGEGDAECEIGYLKCTELVGPYETYVEDYGPQDAAAPLCPDCGEGCGM
jgi:hypothetical protein